MNWFANLSSALGGQKSQPSSGTQNQSQTQNQNSNQSQGTSVTYDNQGNPVNQNQSQNQDQSQNQNQSQNNQNQAPDIEALLFSDQPTNQNQNNQNQNQNRNQNQSQNNQSSEPEIAPGLTPKQLISNLQAINFGQVIPQESIQAALSGDAQAFSGILNQVAQLSAAIAIQQSSQISNRLLEKQKGEWDQQFNSKFTDGQFSQILADPKYANPFVQPMVKNIVDQMRKRDPNITAEQVKTTLPKLLEHAIKSIGGQGNQMNSMTGEMFNDSNFQQPQNVRQQQNKSVNYDDIFG